MKRNLTPEQEEAKKARQARFAELIKEVSSLNDEQRAMLSNRMMVTTCEGHTLSLTNQMLIALQCNAPTIVGGFNQWKAQGRHVCKGEHGLMIWAPSVKPDEQKAETEVHFFTVTVFDISQTEQNEVTA